MRWVAAALGVALWAGVAAAQEDPPGVDPVQFVTAPARVPWAGEVELGWWAVQEVRSGGWVDRVEWAVVGEGDGVWHVEHVHPGLTGLARSFASLEGARLGLVVDKETGRVVEAWLGRAGEAARAVSRVEMRLPRCPEVGEATERLEVGEVEVEVWVGVARGDRWWVGKEGAWEGVVVASQAASTERRVAVEVERGEEWVRVRYDDGSEVRWSEDPRVRAWFGGVARSEGRGLELEVVESGEGAVARLEFPE